MFNKPHGIGGELQFTFTDDIFELQFTFTDDIFDRVEAEYVVCPMDGILVPFFIESYRFRSDTTALMKLEGVDTQEQARQFINTPVYFPVKHAEEGEPGELSWDFFVGFRLEDTVHGHLGEVADVDTSTPNTRPRGVHPGHGHQAPRHHRPLARRTAGPGRCGRMLITYH